MCVKRSSWYDPPSNVRLVTDPLGQQAGASYDALNHQRTSTQSAHLAATNPNRRTTKVAFDPTSRVTAVTDPVKQTVRFGHDAQNRRTRALDARLAVSKTVLSVADEVRRTVDPAGNSMTYEVVDALGRVVRAKNSIPAEPPRLYTYDAADHLTSVTDRLARKREFGYDLLHRQTTEMWRNPAGALLRTLTFSFDAGDNLLTAQDPDSSYVYTYDLQGRALTVNNAGTPLSPGVLLTATYLADSLRSSLAATVAGKTDFRSNYQYDGVSRLTQVEQPSQPADATHNGVAFKRVTLAYNALDQYTAITRYKDLGTGPMVVVTSSYGCESATMATHRLASIVHQAPAMAARSYSFTWDGNDRLRTFGGPDGTSTYDYDRSDQLMFADHSYQDDEDYTYDKNGNRTNSGYVPGDENRLSSDGTYTYEYDAEGNRTVKRRTGERWEYEWDHRNRLTRVRLRPNEGGTIQQEFTYTYDLFDRRLGKSVDTNATDPNPPVVTRFVYDGPHIALAFGGTAATPKNRYLHGAAVDQVFADEQISGGSGPGTVYWPTADHLGTVRDLLDSSGAVLKHWTYDSFGKRMTDSAPTIDFLFSFTGREWDPEAGLYYYRARYYDPVAHVFTSEDPIADDSNPYRYVGNGPTNAIDPDGLQTRGIMNYRFAVSGVPKIECNDPCGPDVTEWYARDLVAHIKHRAMKKKEAVDIAFGGKDVTGSEFLVEWTKDSSAFRHQAAYLLTHKWMDFGSPATGRGAHTVVVGDICIRKNQLGNIGFGLLATLMPPSAPTINTPSKAIGFAIKDPKVGTYWPDHPWSQNYAEFKGLRRGDNLAAFGLGMAVAERIKKLPGWSDELTPEQIDKIISPSTLKNILVEILSNQKELEAAVQSLGPAVTPLSPAVTPNSLVFVPEYGGFNTNSCLRPPKREPWNGPSSIDWHSTLRDRYKQGRYDMSFDDYLRYYHENYKGK